MLNSEHLAKLKEGVEVWNHWRENNPDVEPDLSGADLRRAELIGIDLRGAKLSEVNFLEADLRSADLREAHLEGANLSAARLSLADLTEARMNDVKIQAASLLGANLHKAQLGHAIFTPSSNLGSADLSEAYLWKSDLSKSSLHEANLRGANLMEADLASADLTRANLRNSSLAFADLNGAILRQADLREAKLDYASMVETNLEGANLTGCSVFGISAWRMKLDGAIQSNLVISPYANEPAIQVDNLELAQFMYLILNNEKVRTVIDTITSKVVLILGRFTTDRKIVLDSIRDELRKCGYVPVLFDFEKPASKDLTGTISTLANMSRFIIADLTDPSSVPHELATVAPSTVVPIQTIILEGQREYAMFPDLMRRYHWVLKPVQYKSKELLLEQISDRVIAPAEAKAKELARKSSR
jgi:uncharacterized protein YjbI with pentapeptide repeats